MGVRQVLTEVVARYSENKKGALDADFVLIRYLYRPLSFFPAAVLISMGLTANKVTVLNFAILAAVGLLFLQGSRLYILLGAILFCVYQVLDCVDGNIARYHRRATYYGKIIDGCVDTATVLLFIPVALGYRTLAGASAWDLGLVLAVATTVAGLCNAYVTQRIAYFTLASGATQPETERAPSRPAGGLKSLFRRLNKVYENLITTMPVLLLAAVIFGQFPAFLFFFFVVHAGMGLCASLSKLVLVQGRLNVPREF